MDETGTLRRPKPFIGPAVRRLRLVQILIALKRFDPRSARGLGC